MHSFVRCRKVMHPESLVGVVRSRMYTKLLERCYTRDGRCCGRVRVMMRMRVRMGPFDVESNEQESGAE